MFDRTIRPTLSGLAVLAAAALAAGCGLALEPSTAHTPAPLPACQTEDSVNCHWDAKTQGNGRGRSFTVDANGTVTYDDGGDASQPYCLVDLDSAKYGFVSVAGPAEGWVFVDDHDGNAHVAGQLVATDEDTADEADPYRGLLDNVRVKSTTPAVSVDTIVCETT